MLAGHLAVRRRLGEAFAHDLGGLLQLHRLELGGHRLGLGRRGLARLHRVYGLEHGRDLGSLGSGDLGQRVAVVDLLHIFKQFSEGQPCFPELDRAHVAQGRVDPRVVAGHTHSLTLCRRCSVSGNDSLWTSPLFRLLLADSITALSYGQPFPDRDLSMPKTSSISSIEALANSLPRMPF